MQTPELEVTSMKNTFPPASSITAVHTELSSVVKLENLLNYTLYLLTPITGQGPLLNCFVTSFIISSHCPSAPCLELKHCSSEALFNSLPATIEKNQR